MKFRCIARGNSWNAMNAVNAVAFVSTFEVFLSSTCSLQNVTSSDPFAKSAQTAHEKPEFEASNSTALFGSGNAWTAMSISQHLSVWRFENVSCSYHELYKRAEAEKSCTMPCSECIVWCIAECSPRLKTDTEPGFYQLCATQQTLQTFSKHS